MSSVMPPRLKAPPQVRAMSQRERIRWARLERKLSQERLADLVGITRVHMNRIENGKHVPRPETVDAIAEALDCPSELLAGDEDDEEPSALAADLLRAVRAIVRESQRERVAA